jgi:hypothetical protein
MGNANDTITLNDTQLRAAIETRAASMKRRKETCNRVAGVLPYLLISAIWCFPFWEIGYITWDGHFFPTLIWPWGWNSIVAGWFSRDIYIGMEEVIFFMGMALAYAIVITLLMVRQVAATRRGGRGWRVHLVILVIGSCQLVEGVFFLPLLWVAMAQVAGGIAMWAARSFVLPTPEENRLFKNAATVASKIILDMQKRTGLNRSDVDTSRQQLDWLSQNAQLAGVDIYDASKVGYNAIPGLEARCNLHEISWINGSIGASQLLAISGLQKEQFDAMLPAMCRELELLTDGETVSMKPGQSSIDIMNRIDGYIVQHREIEAKKP